MSTSKPSASDQITLPPAETGFSNFLKEFMHSYGYSLTKEEKLERAKAIWSEMIDEERKPYVLKDSTTKPSGTLPPSETGFFNFAKEFMHSCRSRLTKEEKLERAKAIWSEMTIEERNTYVLFLQKDSTKTPWYLQSCCPDFKVFTKLLEPSDQSRYAPTYD